MNAAQSSVRIVALTEAGGNLARRIQTALQPAREATVEGREGRVKDADSYFVSTGSVLREYFEAGYAVIAICSAGIVVRTLAASLVDKHREPPVVVVAEDGSAVVPLLGGHRGANQLAREIAAELGVMPAITTASDLQFDVALDEPPSGYVLRNPEHYGAFAARLLAEQNVRIDGEAPWLESSRLPTSSASSLTLLTTTDDVSGDETALVYHPRKLAVGVGCERGTTTDELADLVHATLAEQGLAASSVAVIVSLDLKADEVAVHDVANRLGVPARFYTAAELERERDRLVNPSEVVFAEVGCHGVAEGAALASVGPSGELLVPKRKSQRATCAVGLAPAPIDPSTLGRAQGRLAVVGLGPGSLEHCTPAALQAVKAASDIVGYSLYIDLAEELLSAGLTNHSVHRFPLGEERDRVVHALNLAAQGKSVALVCSGDPGIYAMATLVFETIEFPPDGQGASDGWSRADVSVVPGISAAQVAAGLAGGPLGHDFCFISLSDLLTPREAIAVRVEAAATADLVVAFYNPASRTRFEPFEAALATLREHRPPATPVILGRSLGREAQSLRVLRLDELSLADIDMMTVVIVGSSQSRAHDGRVYTPRGYLAKPPLQGADTTTKKS